MIRIALASILFAAPAALLAQTYQAPPLAVRQLAKADPGFDEAIDAADKHGGNPAIQKMVLERANAGNLLAQIYLGEQYLPEECPHLKDATRIGECNPDHESPIGLKPSFEQAFLWLNKASAQGSGEATEIVAEQTERMILEHRPTSATEADVARLHALARKEGFDEEKITVNCARVSHPDSLPLHIHGKRGSYDLPEAEVIAARAVMSRGEIGDTTGESAKNALLLHPEGPEATLWILLDHPLTQDILIPMPLRTSVTAVQHGDGVVLLPANAKHNGRMIKLHRTASGAVKASVPQADGDINEMECVKFPS